MSSLGTIETWIKVLEKGDIKPAYTLFGSKTFRMTSDNPNIFGFPENALFSDMLKKCIKAPKGYVWIVADYDQMEGRILANLSEDENLCSIYNNGIDEHIMTMCKLWPSEVEQLMPKDSLDDLQYLLKVSREFGKEPKLIRLRQKAKTFKYAMQYGAKPETLAYMAKIDLNAALSVFHQWHDSLYPKVKIVREKAISVAQKGIFHLGLGCMIRVGNINREFKTVWSAMCQFWSVLTLIAVHMVNKEIALAKSEAKVVTLKHDAIYSLCPTNEAGWFVSILRKWMERDFLVDQKVKMTVTIKSGTDWSNLRNVLEQNKTGRK